MLTISRGTDRTEMKPKDDTSVLSGNALQAQRMNSGQNGIMCRKLLWLTDG